MSHQEKTKQRLVDAEFYRWISTVGPPGKPKIKLVRKKPEDRLRPIVTVSRQTGSRGSYFAILLAERLGCQPLHHELEIEPGTPHSSRRYIVESLSERYDLKTTEHARWLITSQGVLMKQYIDYLRSIINERAKNNGLVIIGRGANFILGPDRGLHIRVVCSRETRIHNLIQFRGETRDSAEERIRKSDRMRRRLMNKIFNAQIDDPVNYDLVLNTDLLDIEELLDIAENAVRAKQPRLKPI